LISSYILRGISLGGLRFGIGIWIGTGLGFGFGINRPPGFSINMLPGFGIPLLSLKILMLLKIAGFKPA
jgi:hypothetical protein